MPSIGLIKVEQRDYNPPKRERLLEWQTEQVFTILPHPGSPDRGISIET